MITQEQVEQLWRLRSPEFPVTSLFLNLNGGRDSKKSSIVLKDLVKARRGEVDGLSREQVRSIEGDFQQIERYVTDFRRGGAQALAIFSSSGAEMWQVFPLARQVQDRLVIDRHPHVRPLSRLLNEFKRCGVILMARNQATIDFLHLGEITRLETLSEDVSSQVRESGFHGYDERRIERHANDELHHFVKAVAARALTHQRNRGFDYVIVGGSREPIGDFEQVAHRYLTERIIGRLTLGPDAPPSAVLEQASGMVLAREDERARQLADEIIQEEASGGRAIVGLVKTLEEVALGRVSRLVVAKGALRPGVACAHCPHLGTQGAECTQCGADLLPVPDIIEEAVDRCLAQSGEVAFVAAHDRLIAAGGLAAQLRY